MTKTNQRASNNVIISAVNYNNIGQRTNANKAGTAVPSRPSSTITYYDASNRRIAQTTGSNTTVYVYAAWNCIAEYSIQNSLFTIHSSYTWGLDLSQTLQGAGGVGGLLMVSRITNNTVTDNYFPVYDGNGNVTEYIDDSATVVAHYHYDPFGNTTVATGTKANDFSHRFSTKPLDQVSGLYYYGYRYYDPLTGRWPSRDLIEEEGGMNLYGFCFNNTYNWLDYLGRESREQAEELRKQRNLDNKNGRSKNNSVAVEHGNKSATGISTGDAVTELAIKTVEIASDLADSIEVTRGEKACDALAVAEPNYLKYKGCSSCEIIYTNAVYTDGQVLPRRLRLTQFFAGRSCDYDKNDSAIYPFTSSGDGLPLDTTKINNGFALLAKPLFESKSESTVFYIVRTCLNY